MHFDETYFVIPKVCSADHTSGPRDLLKWSTNTRIPLQVNIFFFADWKSLETTVHCIAYTEGNLYQYYKSFTEQYCSLKAGVVSRTFNPGFVFGVEKVGFVRVSCATLNASDDLRNITIITLNETSRRLL